jgi:hypothetical protein
MRTIMHRHFTSTRVIGTVVALCLATTTAIAQQSVEQATELPTARIPGWSFTPAVAIGVVRDSNVSLSGQTVEGETQGDALFNIIPSGQLDYYGRYTDFSASYRGFLRRYSDVNGLDGFDQRASLGFKRAVNRRITLFINNSFSDSPTTDEVELSGVPFRRLGSRINNFAGRADIRLTKYTTVAARYDHTWVEFDRPDEFPLSGGQIHGMRGDVSHQLSGRLAVGGEYSYRTSTLEDDRTFGFHDVGGFIKFNFGPHTTGLAAAGFSQLHDRTENETRHGPYLRLGLTQVLEAATVGVAFERHYVPSFGFGGSNSNQEVQAYILMPIARQRVYVQGSGAWRRSLPFDTTLLVTDTVWLRSTLGYAMARWARIEGVYTFTRQDSIIITGGEVNRHRIGVQFVIAQPMRIR